MANGEVEEGDGASRKWRPNGIVNAQVTLNNSAAAARDRRISHAFPSIDSPDISRRTSLQPDFSFPPEYSLADSLSVLGHGDAR